jgi:hypothetical protein
MSVALIQTPVVSVALIQTPVVSVALIQTPVVSVETKKRNDDSLKEANDVSDKQQPQQLQQQTNNDERSEETIITTERDGTEIVAPENVETPQDIVNIRQTESAPIARGQTDNVNSRKTQSAKQHKVPSRYVRKN